MRKPIRPVCGSKQTFADVPLGQGLSVVWWAGIGFFTELIAAGFLALGGGEVGEGFGVEGGAGGGDD
ncbi:MAG: hypothetical protein AAF074_18850, partial [Pseudomonadota bacterium]